MSNGANSRALTLTATVSVGDSFGTVLQNDFVKNDQQPDSQVEQSQMRDDLIGGSSANSISLTFSAPFAISAVHCS